MREKLLLVVLAFGALGFLQAVDAGNFQIIVCTKDGKTITDATEPTLVVKDRAAVPSTITPTGYNYAGGVMTFAINPAGVGGDKSLSFTITRSNGASLTSNGYWSASAKNPSVIILVVDN